MYSKTVFNSNDDYAKNTEKEMGTYLILSTKNLLVHLIRDNVSKAN